MAVKVIHEALATAIGSRIAIDEPRGQMLLDVGSGASEAIIVARGRIVADCSLRIGGETIDQELVHAARQQKGL